MNKPADSRVQTETREKDAGPKLDADVLDDADLEAVAGGVTWHPDSGPVKSKEWEPWIAEI